jgi:hypothetical protein
MQSREEIYAELNEKRFEIARRDCTPRVMSESGVDALLDRLIEIQTEEALQLLEDEANNEC